MFPVRSLANPSHQLLGPYRQAVARQFSVPRHRIPPASQCSYWKEWARDTFIYAFTGLTAEDRKAPKQAVHNHQKLWVAHWSVDNHLGAHEHYEMALSLQLFENPKNWETQQEYIALLEKPEKELTEREIDNIIKMYELALERPHNLLYACTLLEKMTSYEAKRGQA